MLAGLVLAGYLVGTAAAPVGHGWWLLGHLVAEHHAEEADHDADHDHAPARAIPRASHAAHAHGGHVHTHDAHEAPPPIVVVAMDPGVLPALTTAPVAPAPRGHRFGPGEARAPDGQPAVETPPPRVPG